MQLQIALDRMTLRRAVDITRAVAPYADWIEVGTSLVKHYGMDAVAQLVQAADGKPVLADLKTVDDAAFEFGLAYDAGASSATVLALAEDVTVETAVRVAEERQLEAVVDLMVVPETRRSALAARLPFHVVLAAHIGKDAQQSSAKPGDLLGPWASGRPVAVAGGLGPHELAPLGGVQNLRAIVGSAITGAADPAAAARAVRAAADTAEREVAPR
ncbi:orotidine 5'-phosphate decarboxylase [Paeniglutamicibacter antarcticus]|uniref:Orotidine 5'-phosphate decarboxylase n=1 Tax=Arthrobacter terrae TaxID=2935737 RepID=A0A931CGB1_9MICC|nr:orotidine 5'-phosphate decarboxylase / HUMPS family protein [Arthrobacter terrae]MBG0738052.1 orotidine 5'-phosphate decarboxylase [Arthrobacter terrae]